MKEFRTKMQSMFPAIPKTSESTVEWEDLLKSKWKNRKHLEMALSARTSSRSVPYEKKRRKLRPSKLLAESTELGDAS